MGHETTPLCVLRPTAMNGRWEQQELTKKASIPQGKNLYGPVVTLCSTMFNIHKFSVLSTQYIYVFCVDLRTNSDYFPIQH
jgi:hypothetical protein